MKGEVAKEECNEEIAHSAKRLKVDASTQTNDKAATPTPSKIC